MDTKEHEEKFNKFQKEIEDVVNRNSMEKYCNLPDFVIANYLVHSFTGLCATITEGKRLKGEESLVTRENKTAVTIDRFYALGGIVAKDGNMWGAVIGDMPEHKAAGFEETPTEAILVCMKELRESNDNT